jgi:recombination protein RecT
MKGYLSDESIKRRFEDILGKRSGAFINSIINVVGGSSQLLNVARTNPASVCRAAMRAATVNLAIDPALGHSAIVPYKNEAVFQIMYRGIIQLCIRSGQYKTIHCQEIYRDELKSHNPITGEVKFNDPKTFELRYSEKRTDGDVVGHYVYFKLITGFEKSDYMTRAEVMAHARRYSKAYQYDIKAGKKASPWSTDPIPMGNKTVLLRCLKKYGVMSIDMQEMFQQEYESFDEAQATASATINADMGSEAIPAEFVEQQPEEPKPEKGRRRTRKTRKAKAEPAPPVTFKYKCNKCEAEFNEPKGNEQKPLCANCLSSEILLIAAAEDQKPEFMDD